MKKIEAQIVADSVCPRGERITTFLLTYPRFIHSEIMTHRMFSRNSASSRAIPFAKMIESVTEDPFIPIAFQKDHKGMQGTEYVTDPTEKHFVELAWLDGRNKATAAAEYLSRYGVTKQLCNRILEPFLWHTTLVTATEWDNFFELRCPKYQWQDGEVFRSWKDLVRDAMSKGASRDWVDGLEECTLLERIQHSKSGAEIHIQTLAELMWDAMNESTPQKLEREEWHAPFHDKMDVQKLGAITGSYNYTSKENIEARLKIAVARCARLSYMTHENEIDYAKDIELHDRLLSMRHLSPFEHCARAMNEHERSEFLKGNFSQERNSVENIGWCNNFKGFIPYRYLVE